MSLFVQNSPFARPAAPSINGGEHRVVIATLERPSGDTGIHAHTAALLDGLNRAGVECQLANPFSAGPKWLPMFAVRRLILHPVNKTWSLRWYRHWHYAALRESLTRALLRRPADAVIAQCPVSARAALEVRKRLKLAFRIVMVCHFNFSEATEYREKGELRDDKTFDRIMKLEATVMKTVDEVIYVSSWARDVVERERSITPRKSRLIWNGIAEKLEAAPLDRASIGLGANDLVLMNVGTLEPRKNQLALLELFAMIRAGYPRARLALAGDGPQRTEIERRILKNDLAGSVILLGHRTDVPALLKLADLYVHFAKLESCPIVLLEAARSGLPIAAVPTGGIGELGQNLGALLPLHESDPHESLRRLTPLLDDPAQRQSAGAAARRGFEAHFTSDAMVREYLSALNFESGETT